MATVATTPEHVHGKGHLNYLQEGRGISSWLFTLDHKRIGIMYLIVIMSSFILGGVMALGIRAELFTPEMDVLRALLGEDANAFKFYNQMFTLHGAVMIFLFIIPSIPAALGNFFLPLQLGAQDVAFPRLNLASLYVYGIGAVFMVYSIITGSVDTGWTFYTPYSSTTDTSVVSMTVGAFIMGFSSIFTGLNFIVTIHKLRAPGMGWFRMPLFLWALYATSVIQLLATPVLGITLLLLAIERMMGIGIFDPLMGGDPILYQHFFWFYSHPAVYIMILPAMGVVSELISCHARKPIFGYKFVAFASIGIAIIGFLVWGHHMFTSGQSEIAIMIFSGLTFLVAIPSAIKVFNWTTTLYRGSIVLNTPMLYALGFIFLFTIGGLTGIFLGTMGTDIHLHDTYFVVAHFHYVMVGGTVTAFLGALHHWWPKMTGRMYNEWMGRIGAILVVVGFNWTFFPQFILGTRGMPRRYATYLDQYTALHQFSTAGAMVLGFSVVFIFAYLIWFAFKGRQAPANPWNATTLEWQTTSPPIHLNFEETPIVTGGPYDYGVDAKDATVRA